MHHASRRGTAHVPCSGARLRARSESARSAVQIPRERSAPRITKQCSEFGSGSRDDAECGGARSQLHLCTMNDIRLHRGPGQRTFNVAINGDYSTSSGARTRQLRVARTSHRVVCHKWIAGCGAPVVEVEQSAQPLAVLNRRVSVGGCIEEASSTTSGSARFESWNETLFAAGSTGTVLPSGETSS